MKKGVLLILALAALSFSTFANMQATGWCWLDDDAENAGYTVEELTPISVKTDTSRVIRLRIRFDNMDSVDHVTTGLQYFTAPLPTTNISGTDARLTPIGPDAFFNWATSAFVSDGTPLQSSRGITYNSINVGDRQTDFSPGIFVSSSQGFIVPAKSFTEIEYSIIPTIKAEIGTYYFMPGGANVQIWPEASNMETFPEMSYEGFPISVKGVKSASVKIVSLDGSIQLTSLPEGSVKVSIINTIGQTVKTVNAESTNGQLAISTSDLASGLYIVDIAGVASKKVIIK